MFDLPTAATRRFRRVNRSALVARLICQARSRLGWPTRYAIAIAAAAAAFGARWLMFDSTEARFPALLGYPAVVLCAGLLGAGPAIAAAAATVLLPAWFLSSPTSPWFLTDPVQRSGLLVFLLVSVLVAYAVEALTDAKRASDRARDIADRARAAAVAHSAERTRLLMELNHRVQNANMTLLAMADLMARSSRVPEVKTALLGFRARIRAIGLVHDLLSRESHPEAPVDSRSFLLGLVGKLQNASGGDLVRWSVEADSHLIPRAFVAPMGFIVNELVVNALKHAFPGGRSGQITLRFRRENGDFALTVEDDGVGVAMPDTSGADPLRAYISETAAVAPSLGFGKRFVVAYARNLGGRFEHCWPIEGGGTVCTVRFPVPGIP